VNRTILVRPRAALDLNQQAEFIGRGRIDVEQRFARAVEAEFRRLALMPGIGSPLGLNDPRYVGVRCSPISKFRNHVVLYRPIPEGIEVIRVLNGARNIARLLEADDEPGE